MADRTVVPKLLTPDAQVRFSRIGLPRQPLNDLYHSLLRASWPKLLALLVGLYVLANALFATAYLLTGGIENARADSFADHFFFSVQTMATIGYGSMAPRTLVAHVLVSAEALVGLLGVALVTGLTFTKFARPTARVIFSRVVVIGPRDGVPSLMFRMANGRTNQIVEAQLSVALARDEVTKEGESIRRFHDLRLARDHSILFALTWTAVHPITEASPLYGATPESLRAAQASLIVSLTGIDDAYAQTVHSRHAYSDDEVLFGHRFVDVIERRPDGRRSIDYRRFHDAVALDGAESGAYNRVTGRS